MNDLVHQFQQAIVQSGLTPPSEIIGDGKLKRFSTNGSQSNRNGWYVLHLDGIPSGVFGDWSSDLKNYWKADIGRDYSDEDIKRHRERMDIAKASFEQERIKAQKIAQEKANAIWDKAIPAIEHKYLANKQIKPHGIRQDEEVLLVPLFEDESIVSLQFIHDNGLKQYIRDGKKKGCYYPFGTFEGAKAICLCEGFATGASIHEATGYPVVVAFDAGNLEPVGKNIRSKYPSLPIVVCADDDWCTDGNTGISKGKACASSIGGYLALPIFGKDRKDKDTDFNDMALESGLEAVKQVIDNVLKVDANELWDEPIELPKQLPVQRFDYDLLPESFRPWIKDLANRMQCPPDLPAVAAIVCASSLIGAKAVIQPKNQDTGWQVTPNLWGMLIGRAGSIKSPPVKEVMKPISQLEEHERKEYELNRKNWEIDKELGNLSKKHRDEQVRKKLKANDHTGARALLGEDDGLDEPQPKRYIVNDSTVERLQEIMAVNPWGLLCFRDEIYGLLKSMDKQGQEGSRAFYLTCYDGNQSYSTDRINRDDVFIPRACLSLLGTIQPSRLEEYIRGAVQGGGGDDGLLQRFGLMVFPDSISNYEYVDKNPDLKAQDLSNHVFTQLSELNTNSETCLVWNFSPKAQELFLEWFIPFNQELLSNDIHPAIESHLSKYRKLIPALALIFAHIDTPNNGNIVDVTEVARALDWYEYLRSHAERIYQSASIPETSGARAILRKIKSKALVDGFTSREVTQKHWSGLTDIEVVKKSLSTLVEHNYLRHQTISTKGRPTEQYFINPRVLGGRGEQK